MIKALSLDHFLGFKHIESKDICSGLNVVIGANDTGKTGFLKLCYAISKAYEDFTTKDNPYKRSFNELLADKLLNTFQPKKNGLGELVTKSLGGKLNVQFTFQLQKENQTLQFGFGESTQKQIKEGTSDAHINTNIAISTLFIPAKEVLTAFDAIAYTREQRDMLGFDDTYLDLIKALRVQTRQGNVESNLRDINQELENLFGGSIKQTNTSNTTSFIYKKEDGKEFTMNLTAEGIKKIGILSTLIRNRMLGKGSILFLDEPETALHPKAIRSLAEMLAKMSKAGIQIFCSTHNYFLLKQLAIIAKRDNTTIQCISLQREENGTISNSTSNLKDGLPPNSIVDEALEMFKEELRIDS